MDQSPVRRHVEISARSAAQLELRLHWLAGALAVRQGYIVAMLRRCSGGGRHVASVAYELPLPQFAKPARPASPQRLRNAAEPTTPAWAARQAQGTSSSFM